ncbi:MAG: PDZ domain-containing protein, partial [Deltaproteobacteria bacterium]
MSNRYNRVKFRLICLVTVLVLAGSGAARQSDYDLSRMEALSWVILQVKRDYVDPSRIKPARMLKNILETIEQRVPEIEIKLHDGRATVQVGASRESFDLGAPATVWEMNYALRGPMRFIADNLPSDVDPKDVEFAAIDGMLSTLDPHSNLLPPELFREMTLKTTGEFGGLGIRITIRDGALTIISPLPHTPAARLGLRAGDQIVRIGDQSTVNMPLDEAVNMLRGKPGSKVTIWVMRKGWSEPRKYVITRERIQVHSVESRLLEGGVGYIQIQDFGKHTGSDVKKHLADLKKKAGRLKGLVIDLRNNSGGLMKAAIKTADLFLDRGVIVATVSYSEDSTEENKIQKAREERRAREDGTDTDLPLVVLVNSGSASASEILAGALKNLDRALVVGQQTFGKGTVQILNDRVPESVSGACLKLTVAEYLIPGDISIQEIGVTPDIKLVPMVLDGDDLQAFLERDHFREKDIPAHLSKKHPGRFKPAVVLKYVEEPEPEPKEGEEPPLEEPAFKEDFPIALARRILVKVRTPRGSAMLDEARHLLEEVSRQQQQTMFQKLSARGVDWTASAAKEWDAKAKVTFRLLDEKGNSIERLSADGKAVLELTVSNGSQRPIHRLWAESKSKFSLLDKREFVFGKVEAGRSRSWKVKIDVPRGTLTRRDEVRFVFHCDCSKPPNPLETTIETEGLKRPRFLVGWWLEDSGNGDGLIEPGESITMNLAVTNGGDGKAFKVKGLLKNDAGRDLF